MGLFMKLMISMSYEFLKNSFGKKITFSFPFLYKDRFV